MARTKTTTRRPTCRYCPLDSLPGGVGLCQYHWNEAVWGTAWANEADRRARATETVARPKTTPAATEGSTRSAEADEFMRVVEEALYECPDRG